MVSSDMLRNSVHRKVQGALVGFGWSLLCFSLVLHVNNSLACEPKLRVGLVLERTYVSR